MPGTISGHSDYEKQPEVPPVSAVHSDGRLQLKCFIQVIENEIMDGVSESAYRHWPSVCFDGINSSLLTTPRSCCYVISLKAFIIIKEINHINYAWIFM